MSDWDKTRNGKEMMETIIRYLPRITVCLEEIAKELKVKKIFYTEVKDTKMSYVLTEDVEKVGKKLTETEVFPITELERI